MTIDAFDVFSAICEAIERVARVALPQSRRAEPSHLEPERGL
jgi:hypothetical protein